MEPTRLYIIVITVFIVVIGYDIINWMRYRSFSAPEIKIKRFRSTVNFSVLMMGMTCTLVSIAFHINIFDYKSPIEYADIKSITLRDFKGFKLPKQTLYGENEFAFITTSIEWRSIDDGLEVKTLFHPSRSYVFNENVVNNFLLQHELYHFHIAEYYARQIRRELDKFEGAPSSDIVEKTILTYTLLEGAMQQKYDHETYHGYILKQQKRWQLEVDSLLFSHQKFSSSIVTYN